MAAIIVGTRLPWGAQLVWGRNNAIVVGTITSKSWGRNHAIIERTTIVMGLKPHYYRGYTIVVG